jgi:hypothetical protein
MKALRWLRDRFKDLFYGPQNAHLDLGRIVAFLGVVMLGAAVVANIKLGSPIDLGPNGLGGGLAAFLTAAAAFLYVKDRSARASLTDMK